ncbi:MAG: DUF1016 N-terminal domain-containing protein [Bacteroidetes bacterium]|nr:DUF1016 N-terminal domain-containing protein [Bacteroidota bacterium]
MAANKKKIISSKTVSKKNIDQRKVKSLLFTSVKNILQEAKGTAYRTVNSIMVVAHWHVGRLIVQDEQQGKQKAEYGKAVLQDLSDKLNKEFKSGYSVQNLRSFRQFYLTFPEICSTLWSESVNAKSIQNKKSLIRSTPWSESSEAKILSVVWKELSWSQYKLLMRIKNVHARTYYIKEEQKSG